MKILELTNYSAGICGVWARVREESLRLSRKHDVMVFSSNFTKGNDEKAKAEDRVGGVRIKRFRAKMLGGESFMSWDFKTAEKMALEFKPDLIVCHSYRHPHTKFALHIGKKLGARVFLVTHAPFVENDITRGVLAKIAVRFYDRFLGPKYLTGFDKVIAITNWEIPYLKKLHIDPGKIEYIPNGIPEEFFKMRMKKNKTERKILFLGRVSPIKNLEVLIRAMSFVKKAELEIVGPAEKSYVLRLKALVSRLGLQNRIAFSKPIYDLRKKIEKIDSSSVFVLPSKREAMPQALIEAMARQRKVVASSSPGTRDLIKDGENGFLFKSGEVRELAVKIDLALQNEKIGREARKSVERFSWNKVIKKLEKLL